MSIATARAACAPAPTFASCRVVKVVLAETASMRHMPSTPERSEADWMSVSVLDKNLEIGSHFSSLPSSFSDVLCDRLSRVQRVLVLIAAAIATPSFALRE